MGSTYQQRAAELDRADELATFRTRYHFPRGDDGKPLIYFCGNSLGLQPRSVRSILDQELADWERLGVDGHFEGRRPWYSYHELFPEMEARVVGAKPEEVVVMGSLTTNLHLMMVSFYTPTPTRYRILIDSPAFPSDEYAFASQARFHGFDPEDAIVRVEPRPGEHTLRTEDVEAKIAELGDSLALVCFAGVNYYTGQAYEHGRIAAAARSVGSNVGIDLAHAAGNLALDLHDWDVDFGVWCTYKYLNSGPGGVSGVFVHERHADRPELPRFAGWWGNDPATRFAMRREFVPQRGAAGWQMSNAPVFTMAAHLAALQTFEDAGMLRLRAKSEAMTAFLLDGLDELPGGAVEVITPRDPAQRGCQISLLAHKRPKELQEALQAAGVIVDFRPPNVIRVAPVPMYNTFTEIARFVEILGEVLHAEGGTTDE